MERIVVQVKPNHLWSIGEKHTLFKNWKDTHLTELSIKSTSNKPKIDRRFVQDLIELYRSVNNSCIEFLEKIITIIGRDG
jgi:hypothetical protein